MLDKIVEIKNFSPEIYGFVGRLLPQLLPKRDVLSEEAFRDMLHSENSHLFVIQDAEETMVGMLSVGIYRTLSGCKAWIEDVVVDETYRRHGYGKKIAEYAIGFIRDSGADSISLTTNSSRIAANQLYSLLGFEQYETNVYKMYIR